MCCCFILMASVSTVLTPMAVRNLKPIATVACSSCFSFPITTGKLIKETTYSIAIAIETLHILKENKKRNSFKSSPQSNQWLLQTLFPGHACQSFCLPLNSAAEEAYSEDDNFVVVNFYRFVFIRDPLAEVSRHLSFLEGLDICGRIYLNEQGINAQYSGPRKDAVAYMKWLREDHKFSDVLFQISRTSNGHAFPKLKLRYKPSLVQFEGGISHLPIIDDSMRATPLTPSEWRQRLEVDKSEETSRRKSDSNVILLDVRNGYEWDIGHFCGAKRPDVDCFRSTSFGLTQLEDSASDPLANADKEETEVLMYCTGGIRCDVYSTILRQRGFKKLYTLKGGISHYLKEEGPAHWVGNLFVFDSRLSLPPAQTQNTINEVNEARQLPDSTSFSRCSICSSQLSELRHRNCANLDCNLLFLCCGDCQNDLKGCCCKNCTNASRLRPLLSGNQRYVKWHHYRDQDFKRP